jgi:phage regulator Rha-like protein
LRDIEKMLAALEITDPKLGGSYQDSTGRSLPCFNLPKDLTFTLVLGYDVKRSIERLAERGVVTLPPLAEVSNDGPGPKFIKEYRLGKRDSLVVVAQLCPEFTARIVAYLQREGAAALPLDPM